MCSLVTSASRHLQTRKHFDAMYLMAAEQTCQVKGLQNMAGFGKEASANVCHCRHAIQCVPCVRGLAGDWLRAVEVEIGGTRWLHRS